MLSDPVVIVRCGQPVDFWDALFGLIKVDAEVFIIDLALQDNSSLEKLAGSLIDQLKAKGIERPHLVGHGLAALVAVRVAAQLAEQNPCASLALSGIFAKMNAHLAAKLSGLRSALALELEEPERLAGFTDHLVLPWFVAPHTVETGQLTSLKLPLAEFEHAWRVLSSVGDERRHLRAVQQPTLIVIGADDVFTPMPFAREIAEWSHFAVLVSVAGGHWAPMEEPSELSRVLLGFWGRAHEMMTNEERKELGFDLEFE